MYFSRMTQLHPPRPHPPVSESVPPTRPATPTRQRVCTLHAPHPPWASLYPPRPPTPHERVCTPHAPRERVCTPHAPRWESLYPPTPPHPPVSQSVPPHAPPPTCERARATWPPSRGPAAPRWESLYPPRPLTHLWASPSDMAALSRAGSPEMRESVCDRMHLISSWMALFDTHGMFSFSCNQTGGLSQTASHPGHGATGGGLSSARPAQGGHPRPAQGGHPRPAGRPAHHRQQVVCLQAASGLLVY